MFRAAIHKTSQERSLQKQSFFFFFSSSLSDKPTPASSLLHLPSPPLSLPHLPFNLLMQSLRERVNPTAHARKQLDGKPAGARLLDHITTQHALTPLPTDPTRRLNYFTTCKKKNHGLHCNIPIFFFLLCIVAFQCTQNTE